MKLLKYCLITVMLLFTLSLFAQNNMEIMNTFEGPWGNSKYGEYMATLDFNADGVDDLFVLARNGPSSISEVHVFWGGNNFGYNNTPDYIIPMTGSNGSDGVFACGDVNGDGYDDIAIAGLVLFGLNNPDFRYFRFYYGGPNAELDFTDYDYEYGYLVGPGYYSDREWFTSCLGDVNGDGCDDMGFILQRESTTRGLGVMLGGIFEMIIVESDILPLFFNIEQLGDLNSDGYDDIAISAPYDETLQYPDYQGKVCIYAGNPNLTDTTVSNEDNDVSLQASTNLIIYPNPVSSKNIKINLKLVGNLPKNIENATVSIYNLKGQKVDERNLNTTTIKNSSDAIKFKSLASGFYIATIKINNKRLATSKFIVK